MCACRGVPVCACAHVGCIYMDLSWQFSFLIYSYIPPKSYSTCLSLKLNEKNIPAPSGAEGWKELKMLWMVTELSQRKAGLDQDAPWHVGVRKPAGRTWGGGGLGVHVHVHVPPQCPAGAAAREAEPCQGPRPKQHASMEYTPRYRLRLGNSE